MNAFITHKLTGGLNAYRKPIVVAAIVAVVMSVFISCEQAHTPTRKEPVKVSAPTSSEIEALSEQIKQLVTELEYSDKVAEDFVQMVMSWKGRQGEPDLAVWKQKLTEAKEDYKQGKISKAQLAKVEESLAKQLSQRIRKEISYDLKFYDLADVIKHKKAQCLSYSQLVYVQGNSVGLSVEGMNVIELMNPSLPRNELTHLACIVNLADGKTIMVDLVPGGFVSPPFIIEKELTKVGNYWELKEKDNPLGIHRKVQILNRNGIIALIHCERGVTYRKSGQCTQAISEYNKAIELNPKCALAYNNRGVAYRHLDQYTEAISDYNKAIELNPEYAKAYNNRGDVYGRLRQHAQAIRDFTKAIKLNPKYAEAYLNRAIDYIFLRKHEEAKKDLLKVVQLEPTLKAKVKRICDISQLNLKLD